jgi:hypothetical protein
LRIFACRVVDESGWIWDLVACTPSTYESDHVVGRFECLELFSNSLARLLVSWIPIQGLVAYSIILDADLRYGICKSPHDILHHYHPILFEILYVLASQLGPQLEGDKLTSQKPLHSVSHFWVVPSKTLTNCLKSCSFPPIVWRTLSSLAWIFSNSLP